MSNLLDEYLEFCRVCMKKKGGGMKNLFGPGMTTVEEIMFCTGIHIVQHDKLSSSICMNCLTNLSIAHQFKSQCIETQNTFEYLLGDIKMEDNDGLKSDDKDVALTEVVPDTEFPLYYDERVNFGEPDYNETVNNDMCNDDVGNIKNNSDISNVDVKKDKEKRLEGKSALQKKRDRQTRYRQQNREKLRQRESDRRQLERRLLEEKLRSLGETSTSKNEEKISRTKMTALEKTRERQRRYREQNKEILNLRKAEKRRQQKITKSADLDVTQLVFVKMTESSRNTKIRPNWECNICNIRCKTKGNYTRHRKEVHPEDKELYICEVCGIQFTSYISHYTHVRAHRLPSHSCDYCSYHTIYKGDLVKHIRVHTGEMKFQCQHCSALFRTSSGLRSHVMRRHTRVKVHRCDRCPRAFYTAQVLRRHQDTHDRIKRFECELCHSCFSRRCQWKIHLRKQHGVELQRLRPGKQKMGEQTEVFTFDNVP